MPLNEGPVPSNFPGETAHTSLPPRPSVAAVLCARRAFPCSATAEASPVSPGAPVGSGCWVVSAARFPTSCPRRSDCDPPRPGPLSRHGPSFSCSGPPFYPHLGSLLVLDRPPPTRTAGPHPRIPPDPRPGPSPPPSATSDPSPTSDYPPPASTSDPTHPGLTLHPPRARPGLLRNVPSPVGASGGPVGPTSATAGPAPASTPSSARGVGPSTPA